MHESSTPNLAAFPSSPYAAELARDPGVRAFAAPLEAEYLRLRLDESRTLIRVAALLAVVLAAARGTEQLVTGAWSALQVGQFAVVLVLSLLLAAVACGPWFARLYLPVAQVAVPLRNSLVALTAAGVAANGQVEALALLPLLAIGPFFVLGLRFQAALATVALTLAVYPIAAVALDLPAPLLLRSWLLLLLVAAACAVVARQTERTARKSFLEGHLISELAERDALTGLKNRRVFDEHLEALWQQASSERRVLAILLIDVDHFKAYNDLYGHQAGDNALRRVAGALQAFVTRPQDLLARYGGEEFAVILFNVDWVEAEATADRMRLAVAELALAHGGSRGGVVTISAGVAIVEPSSARRARGALQLADQALYEAKVRGRNRVEVLDQADHQALKTGVFSRGVVNRS